VDLKTEIHGDELRVAQLEQELVDIERSERSKVVSAPKEGGKLGVLMAIAKQRTEELRNSLERVRMERDSAQERLKKLEQLLATFKEEYNPNFNDEGVKRAVRAWEDYVAEGRAPDFDGAVERDLAETLKTDAENGLNWDEWTESSTSETDVCE
jgi:protein kinase C substrate 80K-H